MTSFTARCAGAFAAIALAFSHAPGAASAAPEARDRLAVSADGRHLIKSDGQPFFWLADTAWELFHRLSAEDAEHYLETRRSQGFTVVQAVILAELGGLAVPNANGDLPLEDSDPLRPNEAYFRHVDAVIDSAAEKGIVMALLPTWGDKFNKKWGSGPEIFTPDNARAYGRWLGLRYARKPVVWVLGGDRNPETKDHFAIVRAMAQGIESAGGDPLITYHPQGGSRSWQFFPDEPWLDFHMFQSGHDYRDFANYEFTQEGRALDPPRPVLDAEPRYEDHPVALYRLRDEWRDGPDSWFDDFDVRQAAWWSLLAGAAGHTYGNHNVWQMFAPGRDPVSKARTPWREAILQPGAAQMGIMRRFLQSHGFGRLEPAQQLLAANGAGAAHQRAARTPDGTMLLVYSPLGEPVRLNLASGEPAASASWLDPRTGATQAAIAEPGGGAVTFDPPGMPSRGNDWVLALRRAEQASR